MIAALTRWVDRRLGAANFVREQLDKVFPENWTFLLGEIALYSFVILVASGTFLALFFTPSSHEVVYHGSFEALQGEEVSAAYRSVINLSFDVPAGLLIRQIHHWAALVMVAAIIVHLARVFFTGAFRRPREINWMVGVTLLLLTILEGFMGYSLPDDLLSGAGLRIGYALIESIPVIGTWLASLLFGGMFPGEQLILRLFTAHVFIVPVLITVLIGGHLALIVRQYHTQYPSPGRREDNVVGVRAWPTYAALSAGLFFLVFAVLAGLGGLAQINPVWFYGPYDPFTVTIFAQPDWYVGWLEGALRIFPPWELRGFGYMIANPFFPAVLLPALTFLGLYAYPFIEERLTGDRDEHHILDRPRDRPVRTAVGTGVMTFYFVLFVAGSDDILAAQLGVPLAGMVYALRVLAVAGPVAVALVTYSVAKSLAASGKPAAYELGEAPPVPLPGDTDGQTEPAEQAGREA